MEGRKRLDGGRACLAGLCGLIVARDVRERGGAGVCIASSYNWESMVEGSEGGLRGKAIKGGKKVDDEGTK